MRPKTCAVALVVSLALFTTTTPAGAWPQGSSCEKAEELGWNNLYFNTLCVWDQLLGWIS